MILLTQINDQEELNELKIRIPYALDAKDKSLIFPHFCYAKVRQIADVLCI